MELSVLFAGKERSVRECFDQAPLHFSGVATVDTMDKLAELRPVPRRCGDSLVPPVAPRARIRSLGVEVFMAPPSWSVRRNSSLAVSLGPTRNTGPRLWRKSGRGRPRNPAGTGDVRK